MRSSTVRRLHFQVGSLVPGTAVLLIALLGAAVPERSQSVEMPTRDSAVHEAPPPGTQYLGIEWMDENGVRRKRMSVSPFVAPGDVLISHVPGCVRNFADQSLLDAAYRPVQSPECREQVPEPIFPNSDAPPFKYPGAKQQTHGLDLTQLTYETAEAYFKWLCTNEAGTWVYRKVDDVQGVFAMRNRPTHDYPGDWARFNRYFVEDPWGQINGSYAMESYDAAISAGRHITEARYLLPHGTEWGGPSQMEAFDVRRGFEFFERPPLPEERKRFPGALYLRFTRVWPEQAAFSSDIKDVDFGGKAPARYEELRLAPRGRKPGQVLLWAPRKDRAKWIEPPPVPVNEIRSRYGFFWRGIERSPQDRVLGIGGGEEFIVDLKTNEIVALRRGFVWVDRKWYVPSASTAVDWYQRQSCSANTEFLLFEALRPRDPIAAHSIDLRTAPSPQEFLRTRTPSTSN